MTKIAVVIPSRLQPNPLADDGRLYLDRAIASVRGQTVGADAEIIVGLSPDDLSVVIAANYPPPMFRGALFVEAERPGQAAALNAAVAASTGDLLAFLEDDDTWEPKRLEYGLAAIEQGFDFVSSNQLQGDGGGSLMGINDFATPSGWLMTRSCWGAVGPFDESFKWHLDTEWLGRLGAVGAKRLHFVEAGADVQPRRPWLENVMRFSKVATTTEREPLVNRTVNPQGGMARIATDPVANSESREEHRRMFEKFGVFPW